MRHGACPREEEKVVAEVILMPDEIKRHVRNFAADVPFL